MLPGVCYFRVIKAEFYDNVMPLHQQAKPWTKSDSSL
jgi:hypothetical protein